MNKEQCSKNTKNPSHYKYMCTYTMTEVESMHSYSTQRESLGSVADKSENG